MQNIEKKLLIWSFVLLFLGKIQAQDIHFTQFYNAPQLLNPALTGIFNGDMRFMGHFRRQWRNIPTDYLTFSGNYDMKLYPKAAKDNSFWGLGANINYDNAGFSELTMTQLQIGGSYTKELQKNLFLTGGIQLGIAQRNFDEAILEFDNQYNGRQFDASLPTGENLSNTNFGFADISAGVNLRIQDDNRRSKADIGFGYYHINQPNQSFFDDEDIPLDARLSMHLIGGLKLLEPLDLIGGATVQLQGPFNENVFNLAFRYYINDQRGKELAFQAGSNLRLNNVTDAFVPTAEIHYRTLAVGVSYDINISDFEAVTDRNGGPEIWISYIIQKVKPLSRFKTCPIF